MDWRNSTLFFDGIHLTAAGYQRLFACLYPRLLALRDMQRLMRFGYNWSR